VAPLNGTIAAVATAAGLGAIGVVRISGVAVRAIANRLIGELPPPRVASFRAVHDPSGRAIDEAIVIYFAAPKSFTGEDVLEIQTHGGNIVTRDVLEAVLAAGARPAIAGEFSERAFLNGKINLIQAEAVADLIESASSRAARLALHSLTGQFSAAVAAVATQLNAIRVQLEAHLDFPEDDLPPRMVDDLAQRTVSVRDDLSRLLDRAARGAKLNSGVDIAIIGRPNVGKSTLLNLLAQEERAIVSDEPGTTRDVLSIDINVGGLAVRFHDTAGLREASNAIEEEGVRRAKQTIDRSDAVFHVVTEDPHALPELVGKLSIPVFTIRNKIDLDALPPLIEPRPDGAYLQISARYDRGIGLLRTALLEQFDLAGEADNAYLARERHLSSLRRARDALAFDHARLYGDAPELGAERLRTAGHALGTLTGEYTSEELLGDIFSTFCIGK
jgi:tRNA modification GTPase